MKEAVKQHILKVRAKAERVKKQANRKPRPKPKQIIIVRAPEPLKLNKISDHPRWSEIHIMIVTSNSPASVICQHFDLRNRHGLYAISQVLAYRTQIRQKFPELFASLEEMERKALVQEYVEGIRSSMALAEDTRGLARLDKRSIRVGKEMVQVDSPNFVSMLEAEKVRMAALDKLGAVVGMGVNQQVQSPQQVTQHNTKITVLSMPKQDGVPLRALPMPKVEEKNVVDAEIVV